MFENGNDLKKWRRENKLTQQQVADFAGYSKDRISHIEIENAPISKKLKQQLIQADEKINPPGSLLIQTIQSFLTYNQERKNFFSKEIKPLEASISLIFKNIPKGFEKTIDYLNLLTEWCYTFIFMMKTPYNNQENYNKSVNRTLVNIRQRTSEYVKKYGTIKSK